jgi:hypothetical protein
MIIYTFFKTGSFLVFFAGFSGSGLAAFFGLPILTHTQAAFINLFFFEAREYVKNTSGSSSVRPENTRYLQENTQ